MKTIKSFIIVVLISVLITSCSIPAKTPETGIYHCDELNISIDFSKDDAFDMAKFHYDNGETLDLVCYLDYGDGIEIFEAEFTDENSKQDYTRVKDYILGSFKWKGNEIIVKDHETKKKYIFIEVQNVQDFNVDDYKEELTNFSTKSDYPKHEINSSIDVEKTAQKIFNKHFEYDKEYKPYEIFYDENNSVWLVTGTLPDEPNLTGGVPKVLIKNDGTILAVWHTK